MSQPPPARSRSLAPWLGFAALAVALVAVFTIVMEKRFASGNIYPHYSTLRSDPLGSRAFYESLAALPNWKVSRNLQDMMLLDSLDGESALWLCGLSRPSFDDIRGPDESPVLRAVKEKGARLIITVNPGAVPEKFDLNKNEAARREAEEWWERREEARKKRSGKTEEKAEKDEPSETEKDTKKKKVPFGFDEELDDDELEEMLSESSGPRLSSLFEVKIKSPDQFERPEEGWSVKGSESFAPKDRPVPAELPLWRSQYRFESLGKEWSVAATVDGKPVVIERPYGKGTVVLASDSYFASNEALWKAPHPDFLLWLGGGKTRHIFDETIHGTIERGGAMKMIRRYRFHGFFIGFFLFVALMAWRSGSSLAPGDERLERGLVEGASVAGENAESGFVRLLRRSVPRQRLLRTCLDTWRQTAAKRSRGENARQREAIEAILARHEADPRALSAADAYRQIADAIAQPDRYGK